MNAQAAKKSRRWSLIASSAPLSQPPAPEPPQPRSFRQLPAQLYRGSVEQQPAAAAGRRLLGNQVPALAAVGGRMAPHKEEDNDGVAFRDGNGGGGGGDGGSGRKTRKFFGFGKVKHAAEDRSNPPSDAGGQGGASVPPQTAQQQQAARPLRLPAARAPESSAWAATASAMRPAYRSVSMPADTVRRWSANPSIPAPPQPPPPQPPRTPGPEALPAVATTTISISGVSAAGTFAIPGVTMPVGGRGGAPTSSGPGWIPHSTSVPAAAVSRSVRPETTTVAPAAIIIEHPPEIAQHSSLSESVAASEAGLPPDTAKPPTPAAPLPDPQVRRTSNWAATSEEFLQRRKLNTRPVSRDSTDWAAMSEEFRRSQAQQMQKESAALTAAAAAAATAAATTTTTSTATTTATATATATVAATTAAPSSGGKSDAAEVGLAEDEESWSSASPSHTRSSSVSTTVSTPSIARSQRTTGELAKLQLQAQLKDERLSQMEGFGEVPPDVEMLDGFLAKPAKPAKPVVAELEGTAVRKRPLEQIAELHSHHVPLVQIEGEAVPPSLIPGPHNHRRAATDVRYQDAPRPLDTPTPAPKPPASFTPSVPAYRPHPATSRRQSEPTPPVARAPPAARHSVDLGARSRPAIPAPPALIVTPPSPTALDEHRVQRTDQETPQPGPEFEPDTAAASVPKRTVPPPLPVLQQYIPPPPPPPPAPPATPPSSPLPPQSQPSSPPLRAPKAEVETTPVPSETPHSPPLPPPPPSRPPPLPPKPLPYATGPTPMAMFNHSQAHIPSRFVRAPQNSGPAQHSAEDCLPTPEAGFRHSAPRSPMPHTARPPTPDTGRQSPSPLPPLPNPWDSGLLSCATSNNRNSGEPMPRARAQAQAGVVGTAGGNVGFGFVATHPPKRIYSIPRKPVPQK